MKGKRLKQTFLLDCNSWQLVEACKDQNTYLTFHKQCDDRDVAILKAWSPNAEQQVQRVTSFTSKLTSTSAQLATGVSSHSVREITTIATLPDANFRILTEAQCGGTAMFNKLSFRCVLELRSVKAGKAVQADAEITAQVSPLLTDSQPCAHVTSPLFAFLF